MHLFFRPCRGVRYHLEFNIICLPMQKSFSTCVTPHYVLQLKVFEVLKNHFPILRFPRKYLLTTQHDIVIPCRVLHNHIVVYDVRDEMLEKTQMVPKNAVAIDPRLRTAGDVQIVLSWTINA